MDLEGQSLLRWALDQCVSCREIDHLIVVAPAAWLLVARETAEEAVAAGGRGPESGEGTVRVDVVVGGADRRASVAAGLAVLDDADGLVLVHDAARALAPPALFQRVIDALRGGRGAVIPGLEVVDTIKTVDTNGVVTGTPDRTTLRAIQTPQGFGRAVLTHAHEENLEVTVTDDAGLVEMTGTPIHVVDGDPWAAKITTPDDLESFSRRIAAQQAGA